MPCSSVPTPPRRWSGSAAATSRWPAGRATPARGQPCLPRARRVLIAAEAQEAPAAGYNLACLCALDGNPEGCRMWVTRCEQRGQLPPAEQLLADPDLASVRREAWFAELAR